MKVTIETELHILYMILTATGNPELAMSLLDGNDLPTIPLESSSAGRPAIMESVDHFKNEVRYTVRQGLYISDDGKVRESDYYGGKLYYLLTNNKSRGNTMTIKEWLLGVGKAIPGLPEIESKEALEKLLRFSWPIRRS